MERGAIRFTPSEVAAYYAARVPKLKRTLGRESRGPCPIHNGKDNNFAINNQTGDWCCHSQCGRGGDIISLEMALGNLDFKEARDTVFRIVGRSIRNFNVGARRTIYLYPDEQGSALFRVVRCERGEGAERQKSFYVERFEKGRWQKGFGKVRPVLYRLPEVVGAEQVFIAEGEKAADTLAELGLVGTTCPLGAGKWRPEYAKYLQNKHVLILPDNDDPGRKHAIDVAQSVLSVAASVRIVELPGLSPKGDIADWKLAGGTREALIEIAGRTEPLSADSLGDLVKTWGIKQKTDSTGQPTAPQSGPFLVNDEGVFFLKDDGSDPVRLSARIDVVAITRDDSGRNWGRLLRWRDRDGREHEWAMPMEMIVSDASGVRARLLESGLTYLNPRSTYRERFTDYLQTAKCDVSVLCVPRVGWHGNSFVLPDQTIPAASHDVVVYQPTTDFPHNWKTSGTLEQWRENVGALASGNSRLILTISAGLAGPLLKLTEVESGGFNLHGFSSEGKTTALLVGGSVCGGGSTLGFAQSWRSTNNALEGIAEAHNDGTLFLDELAQVDAREAAETAYLLGNGEGKARMARAGGNRKRARWRLLFVSTGEMTLSEHAASAGTRTRGGADVRMLNIKANADRGFGLFEDLHGSPSPDIFANRLQQGARAYYGTALRAFVERLCTDPDRIKNLVRTAVEAFVARFEPEAASGEIKRAIVRFGLLAAVGEIATEWGITGWMEGEAIEAARRCFEDWLSQRGTVGPSDLERAVRQVASFIETNGLSRFQPIREESPNSSDGVLISNRAGFRRRNSDGTTDYLFFKEVFTQEVCKGFSSRSVLQELDARGFLERQHPSLTIKPNLPGLGRIRVYCVRFAILESDDAESSQI